MTRAKVDGFALTLDAYALSIDPVWARLEPEARGILVSFWIWASLHGAIPSDPVAAARLAGLDPTPVHRWWDALRTWFVAHPTDATLLVAPILSPGIMKAMRRSEAARHAARIGNAKRKRLPPPPPATMSEEEAGEALLALRRKAFPGQPPIPTSHVARKTAPARIANAPEPAISPLSQLLAPNTDNTSNAIPQGPTIETPPGTRSYPGFGALPAPDPLR